MPKITVKVRANAGYEAVEKVRKGYYRVAVKAPAKGGRANEKRYQNEKKYQEKRYQVL